MLKRSSVLKAFMALFVAGQVVKILTDDQDRENDPSLGSIALGLALVGAMCVADDVKAAIGITPLL